MLARNEMLEQLCTGSKEEQLRARLSSDASLIVDSPVVPKCAKVSQCCGPPTWSDFDRSSKIILEDDMLTQLRETLPARLQRLLWTISYDFVNRGISLHNFYENASGFSDTLLIVKTCKGNIFGGFATEEWVKTRPREYYGTGESFVFSYHDKSLKVHRWSSTNDCIQSSSSMHLGIGVGLKGFAFCLDADLDHGTAAPCETFGLKKPLIPESEYQIAELELVTFSPGHRRNSDADSSESLSSHSLFSKGL
jgi:hypothetical protein